MKHLKSYNESLRDKMTGTPVMDVINIAIKETEEASGNMPETLKDYLFKTMCNKYKIGVEIVEDGDYDFEAFGYKYKITPINESLRDKMTGKSKEDIKKSISDYSASKKLSWSKDNMDDLYTDEEKKILKHQTIKEFNYDRERLIKLMTDLATIYDVEIKISEDEVSEEGDGYINVSFEYLNTNFYMEIYQIEYLMEAGYNPIGKDTNLYSDWDDQLEYIEDGIDKIEDWVEKLKWKKG